jgi:hypothetical protein
MRVLCVGKNMDIFEFGTKLQLCKVLRCGGKDDCELTEVSFSHPENPGEPFTEIPNS